MAEINTIKIGGEFEPVTSRKKLADASVIKDSSRDDKTQKTINDELSNAIENLKNLLEENGISAVNAEVRLYTSSGNIRLNKNEEVTIFAEVWVEGMNITDFLPLKAFTWQRVTSDTEADEVWNSKVEHNNVKNITIDGSDIDRKAMFVCTVYGVINSEIQIG
jgi:hypothetical protein